MINNKAKLYFVKLCCSYGLDLYRNITRELEQSRIVETEVSAQHLDHVLECEHCMKAMIYLGIQYTIENSVKA